MSKKKRIVAFVLIAALALTSMLGWLALRSTRSAADFDFEDAVKLEIFKNADLELGTYLEDKNVSGLSRWTYNIIQEVCRNNNYALTTDKGTSVTNDLVNRFTDFVETDLVITDGLGTASELTKSYVANIGATALFTVCPDARKFPVVDTNYQAYKNTIKNSADIKALNGSISDLEKMIENYEKKAVTEGGVNPEYLDQLKSVKNDLEAANLLIDAMDSNWAEQLDKVKGDLANVKEGTVDAQTKAQMRDFESDLTAQYSSLMQIELRLNQIQNETNGATGDAKQEVNNLKDKLAEYLQTIEGIRDNISTLTGENQKLYGSISDTTRQFVQTKAEIDLTVAQAQNSIAANKTELQALISTNKTSLESAIANATASNTSAISSARAELSDAIAKTNVSISTTNGTLSGLSDTVATYISTNDSKVASLDTRLTNLEALFSSTKASLDMAYERIAYQAGNADTAGLRTKVATNCTVLTNNLSTLRNTLITIQGSASDAAISTKISNAIVAINDAQQSVEDYKTSITARIDDVDAAIADAQVALANGDTNATALLIDAASGLLSVENAENVYRGSVQVQVNDIASVVASIINDGSIHNDSVTNTKLNNAVDSINEALAQQAQDFNGKISDLESDFTNLINNLNNGLTDTNTALATLTGEYNANKVIRIEGFALTTSDWLVDSTTGKYYVEINHPSLLDSSHVEIKYAGFPDISPTYVGDGVNHKLKIVSDTPSNVTISDIFIFNQVKQAQQ